MNEMIKKASKSQKTDKKQVKSVCKKFGKTSDLRGI